MRARVALVSVADHLRGQVAEDLAAFDDLRIAEPVRRESIRVELRGASRRYRYADGYPAVMLNGPRLMGVYAALLAAFAVFCIRNWEVQPVSFALHLLVAAGGLALLSLIMLAAVHGLPAYLRRRGPATAAVLGTFTVPVVSLVVTYAQWKPYDGGQYAWSLLWGWDAGCMALLVVQVAATVEVVWQGRRIDQRCKPYDGLALATARAAAKIAKDRHRWSSGRVARAWCEELEDIAARTELVLALRSQTPGRSRRLRHELRCEAVRIAEAFREHQRLVATAYSATDVDEVDASLVCAVEALLAGDRDALLAHAPDQVPLRTLLRRVWVRAWPASVLVVAGFVLPALPPVQGSPAELSLKVSLIVLGVLKLVAPQVSDQVGSMMDKALPWK